MVDPLSPSTATEEAPAPALVLNSDSARDLFQSPSAVTLVPVGSDSGKAAYTDTDTDVHAHAGADSVPPATVSSEVVPGPEREAPAPAPAPAPAASGEPAPGQNAVDTCPVPNRATIAVGPTPTLPLCVDDWVRISE
jgi:hypothetical protein